MILQKLVSLERWCQEVRTPSRRWTRSLLDFIHGSYVRDIIAGKLPRPQRALVVWDGNVNAITFDFVWFVFDAYCQLNRLGYKEFDLLIREPVTSSPVDPLYDAVVPCDERRARVTGLIIPIASLFSCVKSVIVPSCHSEFDRACLSLEDFLVFPFGYSDIYNPGMRSYLDIYGTLRCYGFNPGGLPFIVLPSSKVVNDCSLLEDCSEGAQSSPASLAPVSTYLTLTLRDYGYSPERNSSQHDVDEAYAFAKELGVALVIVPDDLSMLHSYSFPSQVIVASKARLSLFHRTALYSQSVVNIFPPSGPASLSLFLRDSKTIFVDFGAGGDDGNFRYYRRLGLMPNQQPFLVLGGYLLWSSVKSTYTSNSLRVAFESLCSLGAARQ